MTLVLSISSILDMENSADSLIRDYNRFLVTSNRLVCLANFRKRYRLSGATHDELIKILERWTISTMQRSGNPWGPQSVTKFTPESLKMASELVEKRIPRPDAVELTAELIGMSTLTIKPAAAPLTATVTPTGDITVFDSNKVVLFHTSFPPQYIQKMLQRNNYINEIAAAALRYRAILAGSQQWAVPAKTYDTFVKKFGITMEGFASPFNAQPQTSFCSIFQEDSVFGGLGDFFNQDLQQARAIINPPFIESLIESVVHKIEPVLDDPAQLLCVVVPLWRDAVFYKLLTELAAKHKSKCIMLTPDDNYSYEDHSLSETKKIPAKFKSVWFCFGKDVHNITKFDIIQ
jgi:hypothetical protein